MGPLAQKLYADLKLVAEETAAGFLACQHFNISDRLINVAADVGSVWSETNMDKIVYEGALPADDCVFECSGAVFMLLCCGDTVKLYDGISKINYSGKFKFISEFAKRGNMIRYNKELGVDYCSSMTCLVDAACSLIAEPRLVVRSRPTRAERRRAERTGGAVAEVWNKVSWTVGDSTIARCAESRGAKMPLHFSRAHWTNYKNRKTPKGERRPGHDGWWVWTKHSWKGHPDYGVKRHVYTPDVDPDGVSLPAIAAQKKARMA